MNAFQQGLLKIFKENQLKLLSDTVIGIAGAGGLGSNVAAHLVRSGFSKLVIVDFDRVESSNLNRQFFFYDQIGQYKVEALAQNLKRINPELELTTQKELINEDNILNLFGSCDIWVEALDDPSIKKLFVETGLTQKKRVVSASGLAGWGNTDSIKSFYWNSGLAVVGDKTSAVGDKTPPVSSRVGVVAAKQSDIVLTWVISGEER